MRWICIVLTSLVLAGCASSENLVRHKMEAQASSKDPEHLAGFSDGCTTGYAMSSIMVRASYTKNAEKYRLNRAYAKGWDEGRAACNFPGGSPTFLIGRG